MKIENNINQLETKKLGFEPMKQNNNNNADKAEFGGFFDAAVQMFDKTNDFQVQANKEQIDFATGKNKDMLSVMLAQEKAYSTLNFTVQTTNKVIEAYKEVMRIQM